MTRYVALGARRYRVDRPWAKYPPDLPLGVISKGAVDHEENLYLCQRLDPPVLVFDREGSFLRSFGDGLGIDSHGISVVDERVFVVDRDGHRVLAFDLLGRLLFTMGDKDHPRYQAPFSHPTDIAAGPSGELYVTDGYGNAMVHRFSADGTLEASWGAPGIGPGQFTTPHGLKVLPDGRVLVCDRDNNRVQVLGGDGKYLSEWTGFFHPMDIFVDAAGIVYVSDQIPSVQARNQSGEFIGRCSPGVAQPHGLTGNGSGSIFVIETRSVEITRLFPA